MILVWVFANESLMHPFREQDVEGTGRFQLTRRPCERTLPSSLDGTRDHKKRSGLSV